MASYKDKGVPYRFNEKQDKYLDDNDLKNTIFQPDINLEMGINILAHQIANKGAILLVKGLYWSVLRLNGKHQKEITTMVRNIVF